MFATGQRLARRVMDFTVVVGLCAFALPVFAAVYGPWNTVVLPGGIGFKKSLPARASVLKADATWTISAWVRPQSLPDGRQLLAGVGDPTAASRYFFIDDGKLGFRSGKGSAILSQETLQAKHWQFVAAVARDGRLALYLDGERVATGSVKTAAVKPELIIGPVQQPWPQATHFGGKVAAFTIRDNALDADRLAALSAHSPDPKLTRFTLASPHWPVQTRQMAGQVTPQPPSTLPESRAPFSEPVAKPLGKRVALKSDGKGRWILGDWSLASAPDLEAATGGTISGADYKPGQAWMAATVPGTVLTTLVDRGVYPDPAYGLNNMAIPESLNKHDWWYRTTFTLPADMRGKQLQLNFNGINYAAAVWVNGERIGNMKGAFVRGQFDVTKLLRPDRRNAVAVRVTPPPHPGVPNEESLVGGPGPNGGALAMDGPTFIASEGWDWIPSIRDRDTGLWQDVVLHVTGKVRIGDAHVITRLPHPKRHERANIDVDVPLHNAGTSPVTGQLTIRFGDVTVKQTLTVPPGGTVVHLQPSEYPQLALQDPHLWWPNGYGDPYLYQMQVDFAVAGNNSDHKQFKFGVRQVSYELSLFDDTGHLRRVLITPGRTKVRGKRILDVSNRHIHKTPRGWAYSLLPGTVDSPAVKPLKDDRLAPDLTLRVNGVRIAVKGGSWGTDDFLKRVSRKRLEPYFRLARNANINTIRNWVGQSTEKAFYQLADKYGLLVLNDFWQSTQNYNMEPQDDALFVRNAKAVIRRFRNHPSIILWFGRNEGVPQPLLNKRLDRAISKLDGTRLYLPSSNSINLAPSGPYNYRPPEAYFTKLAKGFAVEIGTMSFPTLKAFKAMVPKADRWPISDTWAYHDWHSKGNGDTASFMTAMRTRFGKPDSLEDFARKAQMMNYVNYRAIFEGFNANLWSQNSGRLLWMTHPAWPSTTWQIYSHDYDTNGAYYGVKKASEPVHVQMNLPDHHIVVVNNRRKSLHGLRATVRVYALDGSQIRHGKANLDAPSASVTRTLQHADISKLLADRKVAFVQLQLHGADGKLLSRNLYWASAEPSDLRALGAMAPVKPDVVAQRASDGGVAVRVSNPSGDMALSTKLTLVDAGGERILPAYYSNNYINLAPGACRVIDISGRNSRALHDAARIEIHGWNIKRQSVEVGDRLRSSGALTCMGGGQ